MDQSGYRKLTRLGLPYAVKLKISQLYMKENKAMHVSKKKNNKAMPLEDFKLL